MPQCRRHFCLWMIKITASRLHNADYFSLSTSNQGSSSPPTGSLRLKVCKRSHLGSSCIPSIGLSNVLARTRRVSSLFYFSSLLHTATWPGSVCSQHSYKYSALHYSTSPRALVERPPPGGSPLTGPSWPWNLKWGENSRKKHSWSRCCCCYCTINCHA